VRFVAIAGHRRGATAVALDKRPEQRPRDLIGQTDLVEAEVRPHREYRPGAEQHLTAHAEMGRLEQVAQVPSHSGLQLAPSRRYEGSRRVALGQTGELGVGLLHRGELARG